MRLYELRRNSDKNKKKDLFSHIKDFSSLENKFLSFTDVPKLGINPKSYWTSTPIGIYAYPLWLMPIEKKKLFPFGMKRRYAIFFEYNGPILSTSLYSMDDFDRDLSKLKEKYPSDIIDKLSNDVKIFQNPFSKLNRLIQDLSTYPFEGTYPKPSKWSLIYLEIGHTCIVDNRGLIHGGEPIQSVFFSRKGITNIDIINNSFYEPSHDKVYEWDGLLKSIQQEIQKYRTLKNNNSNLKKIPKWIKFQLITFSDEKGINIEKILKILQKTNMLNDLFDILYDDISMNDDLSPHAKKLLKSELKNFIPKNHKLLGVL